MKELCKIGNVFSGRRGASKKKMKPGSRINNPFGTEFAALPVCKRKYWILVVTGTIGVSK